MEKQGLEWELSPEFSKKCWFLTHDLNISTKELLPNFPLTNIGKIK